MGQSVLTAPNPALSAWAGQYDTTTAGGWDTYFSPLVVHADGTVDIAGSPLPVTYDPESATASFSVVPIRATAAEGQITFATTGDQTTFSGTITPYPGGPATEFTGQLSVRLPVATLDNLVEADGLLTDFARSCYIAASGSWIAVGQGDDLVATAAAPYMAQPFEVHPKADGGFYLTVAGETWVSVDANGVLMLTSDTSQAIAFHAYASVNGYAVIGTTDQYWCLDTSSRNMVLVRNPEFTDALLLNIIIQPHAEVGAELRQYGVSAPGPLADASDCDWAIAALVWQVTGGLFLAIGIGPYISSGAVSTGVVGLIKSSPAGTAALSALVAGAKQNPEAVAGLAFTFLGAIQTAGLLWPVVKFVLSTVGWYIVFRVLAKILEVVLLPEAEAIELLASFAVWTVQSIASGVQVGADCAS